MNKNVRDQIILFLGLLLFIAIFPVLPSFLIEQYLCTSTNFQMTSFITYFAVIFPVFLVSIGSKFINDRYADTLENHPAAMDLIVRGLDASKKLLQKNRIVSATKEKLDTKLQTYKHVMYSIKKLLSVNRIINFFLTTAFYCISVVVVLIFLPETSKKALLFINSLSSVLFFYYVIKLGQIIYTNSLRRLRSNGTSKDFVDADLFNRTFKQIKDTLCKLLFFKDKLDPKHYLVIQTVIWNHFFIIISFFICLILPNLIASDHEWIQWVKDSWMTKPYIGAYFVLTLSPYVLLVACFWWDFHRVFTIKYHVEDLSTQLEKILILHSERSPSTNKNENGNTHNIR